MAGQHVRRLSGRQAPGCGSPLWAYSAVTRSPVHHTPLSRGVWDSWLVVMGSSPIFWSAELAFCSFSYKTGRILSYPGCFRELKAALRNTMSAPCPHGNLRNILHFPLETKFIMPFQDRFFWVTSIVSMCFSSSTHLAAKFTTSLKKKQMVTMP